MPATTATTGIPSAFAHLFEPQRANLEAIAAGTLSPYGPLDGQLPHPPELNPQHRAALELLLAALIAARAPLATVDETYTGLFGDAQDMAWSIAWALGRPVTVAIEVMPAPPDHR